MSEDQNNETKALTRAENRAEVPMGAGVQINSFEALQRFAGMVAASGLAPKDMTRMETIAIAIEMGLEVGLKPMQALQNVAVINGRPSIWGDAALALVESSGLLEDINETWTGKPYDDDYAAAVMVKRRGRSKATERTFSVADAKIAGLWKQSGPWTKAPKRMLQMRARAFALRDTFSDVLRGLAIAEETQDYIDIAAAPVSTPASKTLDDVASRLAAKQAATPAPAAKPEPADEEAPFEVDAETGEILNAEPEPEPAKPKPSKTAKPEPAGATGGNGKQAPLLGDDAMF